MSDFIRDLYYGEIKPVEGAFDENSEAHKAFLKMEKDKKFLVENTDGEVRKRIASYFVNTEDFYTYNEADVFERGFRMCAQMIKEILFNGKNMAEKS